MQKVFIGFSSPKKFKIGAECIKLYMGTKYSHVYLRVYSNFTGQWLVYQASHGTVHVRTYEKFQLENIVVREFELEIPLSRLQQTIRLAQQLLGAPYGYIGIIKLVLSRFFKGIKGDGISSFHCSEFIATLFPELILTCKNYDFIEPVDLYQSLEGRFC